MLWDGDRQKLEEALHSPRPDVMSHAWRWASMDRFIQAVLASMCAVGMWIVLWMLEPSSLNGRTWPVDLGRLSWTLSRVRLPGLVSTRLLQVCKFSLSASQLHQPLEKRPREAVRQTYLGFRAAAARFADVFVLQQFEGLGGLVGSDGSGGRRRRPRRVGREYLKQNVAPMNGKN